MSDDNFGPWIDWAGGPCPIPDAKAGEYELRFADGFATDVTTRHWANTGEGGAYGAGNIIAYHVRLPADDLLRRAIEALRPFAAFSIADNDGSVAGQIRIQPDAEHVMTRDELEELLRPSATIVASTGNMAFGGDRPAENKFVTVGDMRKARAVLTAYDKRGK